MECCHARLRIAEGGTATLHVADSDAATFAAYQYVPYVPVLERWGGPYEVTPQATAQTLATSGLQMARDLTIDPIPSNYGLVTWDGSTLTVS